MVAPSLDAGVSLAVEGLRSTWRDGVLELVLDRPAVRNALSIGVRRGLIAAARAVDDDPGTAMVVLTGTDPAFSAGVDLKESLGADGRPPRGARTDPASVIRSLRTPVVAAVNGPCYAGALELALNCSFIVASERATFADTHVAVGILPGWGQTALLPRAVGVRMARRMMLTGEPLDAAAALRAGLVTEVVPHDGLLDRVREIGAAVRAAHPGAAAEVMALLADGEGVSLAHALALEARAKLRWRTDGADTAGRFAGRTRGGAQRP